MEPRNYSSGYYTSEKCKPNDSEWRIFHKFQSSNTYPPTVREALRDLKEGENDEEGKLRYSLSKSSAVYS